MHLGLWINGDTIPSVYSHCTFRGDMAARGRGTAVGLDRHEAIFGQRRAERLSVLPVERPNRRASHAHILPLREKEKEPVLAVCLWLDFGPALWKSRARRRWRLVPRPPRACPVQTSLAKTACRPFQAIRLFGSAASRDRGTRPQVSGVGRAAADFMTYGDVW